MQHSVLKRALERQQDSTFEPSVLADDLHEVSGIYANLFKRVDETIWDRPVKRGADEWTLRETIAHLAALNGAGLECMTSTLRGDPYVFDGLDTRYKLKAYNRSGIEAHKGMRIEQLVTEFLHVHDGAAEFARKLVPGQGETTLAMPIYNRPVRVTEALSIIMMHAALIHSAQVAEPAGVHPLWSLLPPELRHRAIGRLMRAFSLLYRRDIGGHLRTSFVFHVEGPGGGDWCVEVSPERADSYEGIADSPGLLLRFRETGDLCRMVTGRMNLPLALVRGRLKLRGDLRLFPRMSKLFSTDARP